MCYIVARQADIGGHRKIDLARSPSTNRSRRGVLTFCVLGHEQCRSRSPVSLPKLPSRWKDRA